MFDTAASGQWDLYKSRCTQKHTYPHLSTASPGTLYHCTALLAAAWLSSQSLESSGHATCAPSSQDRLHPLLDSSFSVKAHNIAIYNITCNMNTLFKSLS